MKLRHFYVVVASLLGIGAIVIAVLLLAPKPPIPGSIKSQLTSTLLVPVGKGVEVDRESARFDADLNLLTYNATWEGRTIVVSQQPAPESFADIPGYYDKVTAQMSQYAQFDVEIGSVRLTRPKDAGGKPAAVLYAKGTLLFAKPDAELSTDQWRRFFTTLTVIR